MIGLATVAAISASAVAVARPADARTSATRAGKGCIVELLPGLMERESGSLVVDRRHRQAGLNQLYAPAVGDAVIRCRGDGDGPAEVVGDADAHAGDSRLPSRSALNVS